MADTMTCPLCRRVHPAGTTWCTTLFQDISHLLPSPPPPAGAPLDTEVPEPPTETESHVCPECGTPGRPGESCTQCMQIIPLPSAPSSTRAYVVLPSLHKVAIPRGCEIVLGRQSNIAEVRAALEPFDGVSRQHCYVTIDPLRDVATIRDTGSMNCTWVGDDAREIGKDERRKVDLPAQIRLGQTAYLTITLEDGS